MKWQAEDASARPYGFEADSVRLALGAAAQMAEVSAITVHYLAWDDAAGAWSPREARLDATALAATMERGDDGSRTFEISRNSWQGGYFQSVEVDFASFPTGLGVESEAVLVEVHGTAQLVTAELPLTGTLKTTYEEWVGLEAEAADTATLKTPDMGVSIDVKAFTGVGTATEVSDGVLTVPYGVSQSGYRVWMGANTGSPTLSVPARFTMDVLHVHEDDAQVGFLADEITLTTGKDGELAKMGALSSVTLRWRVEDHGEVEEKTYSMEDLASYWDEAGHLAITSKAWDEGTLVQVELAFAQLFAYTMGAHTAETTPMLEIHGMPTGCLDEMPLQGTFSAALDTAGPHAWRSGQDEAALQPVSTFEDPVSGSAYYTGAPTERTPSTLSAAPTEAERTAAPVPYRWGEGDGEGAWFEMTVHNKTAYAWPAATSSLEIPISADGHAAEGEDGAADPADACAYEEEGFVALEVQVDGFATGEGAAPGAHRSGEIDRIELYDWKDPDQPAVTIQAEDFGRYFNGSGLLSISLADHQNIERLAKVSVHHTRIEADDAAQKTAVVRVRGVAHSAKTMTAQTVVAPDDATLSATRSPIAMGVFGFDPEASVQTFRAADGEAGTGTFAEGMPQDEALESRYREQGVGYRMVAENRSLARADGVTLSYVLQNIENRLAEPNYALRGYHADKLAFSPSVLAAGQTTSRAAGGARSTLAGVKLHFLSAGVLTPDSRRSSSCPQAI